MASQITSLAIVYSNVYSGTDERKHQSSASLFFVQGIHRWPINSPHKGPVTRKMFPFDDVIMSKMIPKSCVDVLGQLCSDYLIGPILIYIVIFSGIFHDWYQMHIHRNVCVPQDHIVVKSTSRSGYDSTCSINDEILPQDFTVQLVLNINKCILTNIFQGILISIYDFVMCRLPSKTQ